MALLQAEALAHEALQAGGYGRSALVRIRHPNFWLTGRNRLRNIADHDSPYGVPFARGAGSPVPDAITLVKEEIL